MTRKCLQSKQKELKKVGRGKKDKAAVTLTEEEIDILYCLLGVTVCLEFPLLNHCPGAQGFVLSGAMLTFVRMQGCKR